VSAITLNVEGNCRSVRQVGAGGGGNKSRRLWLRVVQRQVVSAAGRRRPC